MGTNAIVGGGVPQAAGFALGAPAGRHRRRLGHLLRRRRRQHRLGAGDDEPRRRLEAAGLLLHREQPVRRLDHRRTRPPASRGCPRAAWASASPAGRSTAWTRSRSTSPCSEAVEHMRAGDGPTVVEAETYRYFHQNGPFPGSAFGYRTKEEEAAWRDARPARPDRRPARPPRPAHRGRASPALAQAKAADGGDRRELVEPDPDGKPGQRRIRPAEWPDPAFVDVGIRGDLCELDGAPVREPDDFDRRARASASSSTSSPT